MAYTRDAQARAGAAFLYSQLTYIESRVLEQPYPQITYPQHVYVDTSAPEGVEGIAFQTLDWAGEPAPIGDNSNDVPMVSLAYGNGLVPVRQYSLGYEYGLIELLKANTLNTNGNRTAAVDLLADKVKAARAGTERFLNKLAYIGDQKYGLINSGLLNYPTVPVVTTGALLGGTNQTLDQILAGTDPNAVADALLRLFNNAYQRVYVTQTNTNYRPTHILLDPISFGKLAATRIPNTDQTYITYLQRVIGAYGITFDQVQQLQGAGVGGTNRMMVMTRDDDFVKFHLPRPFQLETPVPTGPLTWAGAGVVRTAGTEIRIPAAQLYVDGL